MLISCEWKPEKLSIVYKNGIVVLTRIWAWAAIVTSVHKGFLRASIQGRGIAVPRFVINKKHLLELGCIK